ncbi:hypothetical protein [Paenibacillus sp. FSL K6-2524]
MISTNDNIDTTSSVWKVLFGLLTVFAEFERNIIIEPIQSN